MFIVYTLKYCLSIFKILLCNFVLACDTICLATSELSDNVYVKLMCIGYFLLLNIVWMFLFTVRINLFVF